MVYKGKINGCTGFKMGKELKSMSVMIIIPMGIEKIEAWILLTHFMLERAYREPFEYTQEVTESFSKFCDEFNIDGHYIESYLKHRIEVLNVA